MRVKQTLHELALPPKGVVHEARRDNVALAVWALLEGERASVTAIGRGLDIATTDKHRIKRCDRLLSNPHLHAELPAFYRAIARRLLANVARPILLIDWTSLHKHVQSLVVAVPVEGRAIPICVETIGVPMSEGAMRGAERTVLRRLRLLLPPCARPVFVADAGFRSTFIRDVIAAGWDVIARVRGTTHIRLADGVWRSAHSLHARAQACGARDLGNGRLARQADEVTPCRFILGQRPRARRLRRRWYPPRRGSAAGKAQKAAKEPWLLATTLTDLTPAHVAVLYATRMRLEETFRDAKCPRYGWFLDFVRSRRPDRYAVLWLIVAIAMLAVTLLGFAAEARRLHHCYQANTVRHRRVLSWFALGCLVLRRPPRSRLRPPDPACLAHLLGIAA